MYRIIGADGREYGPVSADQLRQWIAENRANATTRVLAEGATEWKPLGSLPEFSPLFAGPTPQAVTPAVFPSATVSVAKVNGFAVAGMVMGILSLPACCCCYGLPFNLLGLAFSIIGLVQIKSEPQRYRGQGMAITGLVLCILSFLLTILLIILGAGANWIRMPHHAYRL